MSTKNIIISLVGVIVIGSAVYFTITHTPGTDISDTIDPIQKTGSSSFGEDKNITMDPDRNASNDEIINYLVEGQSNDEKKAAQVTLKASSTVEIKDPTISTNF